MERSYLQQLFGHKWYPIFICCLVGLLPIYDFFIQVAPGVMVDGLMSDFHRDASSIGVLGAVFYLSYAVCQPPSGFLIDQFGIKSVLVVYTFITALSAIIFSNTHSFYVIVFMRLLAGFGVCIAFIGAYYIAAKLLPHKYFSLVAALLHLAGAMGGMIAQAPLAFMVGSYGWRTSMWLCGLLGLMISLIFIFTINIPQEKNNQTTRSKGSFYRSLSSCLKNPQVIWIALCSFLGWLPMTVIGAMWGIPYLSKVYNWPAVQISSLCTFFWIGSAIGGLILSWGSERYQCRKPPLVYSFLIAFISGVIFLNADKVPVWLVAASLFMLGITVCIQTMSFVLIKETVERSNFALASGINNFVSMMSGALGQHLVGALLVYQSPDSTSYTAQHFQHALYMVPLGSLFGFIICRTFLKETYRKNC